MHDRFVLGDRASRPRTRLVTTDNNYLNPNIRLEAIAKPLVTYSGQDELQGWLLHQE
jgi:hypothetical protein